VKFCFFYFCGSVDVGGAGGAGWTDDGMDRFAFFYIGDLG
jgi:hypothetical protein